VILIAKRRGKALRFFCGNAKEKSFGSSLSRKACGEHERQSLSVKAQRRRENSAVNRTATLCPCQRCAGNTKSYERVPNHTTRIFEEREYCSRMKSDSDSESDFSTRKGRPDTVVRLYKSRHRFIICTRDIPFIPKNMVVYFGIGWYTKIYDRIFLYRRTAS
jgi:hypothetical protein